MSLAATLLVGTLAACQPEERLVRYKPFLTGVDGAVTQTPAVGVETRPGDSIELSPENLIVENPDGSKTLVMRSGRQLMWHIQRCLAEGERDLFGAQVLCKLTRDEFAERGIDAAKAYDMLKLHEQAISKLFARMPMAEHTPSVRQEMVGRNIVRVRLAGRAAEGLTTFRGFDMMLEQGHWRLRWFVK
ncbi:MAG: hypothetical protein ACKVW3_05380 [Phycisphaerales bacterium]